MRIKTILSVLFLILGGMALALAGLRLWQTVGDLHETQRERRSNDIYAELSRGVIELSLERSVIQLGLNLDDPMPAAFRDLVQAQRAKSDAHLARVVQMLAGHDELRARDSIQEEVRHALARIADLRAEADRQVALPRSGRTEIFIGSWPEEVPGLIARLERLRFLFRDARTEVSGTTYLLAEVMHRAFTVREKGGQDRSYLALATLTGQPLEEAQLTLMGQHQARVMAAQLVLTDLAHHPDLPAHVQAALAELDRVYFGEYQTLRAGILAASAAGAPYPVSFEQTFERSQQAMALAGGIVHLVADTMDAYWADRVRTARLNIAVNGLLLLAGLAIVLAAGWMLNGVTGRLHRLAHYMHALAGGAIEAPVPAAGRWPASPRDEIGEMASAVAVFREGLVENRELQRRREEDAAAAAQARRAAIAELADDLERTLLGVAETVGEKSEAIRTIASRMGQVGESGSNRSIAAAGAAEEAAARVMGMAAGAEAVRDAMREAQEKVQQAAGLAADARSGVDQSEGRMRALAEAVDRIGSVLALIEEIAAQTNLLALNATIEAARAGAAGKGFAVVAGEVKSLANQTARATVDIRDQIASIRAATDDAGAVMRAVTESVRRIADLSGDVNGAIARQGGAIEKMMETADEMAAASSRFSDQFANVALSAATSQAGVVRVIWGAEDMRAPAEALRARLGDFLARLRA